MTKEPTLERIWEARRKIYEQCENDPQKLVEYYMQLQKQNPERLLGQLEKRRRLNHKSIGKQLSVTSA